MKPPLYKILGCVPTLPYYVRIRKLGVCEGLGDFLKVIH